MSPIHIQTIHADAIRADHMRRAEARRRLPAREPRIRNGERLRAVVVAFRRPELVSAERAGAGGC